MGKLDKWGFKPGEILIETTTNYVESYIIITHTVSFFTVSKCFKCNEESTHKVKDKLIKELKLKIKQDNENG